MTNIPSPTSDVARRATEVDVLLLLEGTFPYVAGGVSSWVNHIIRGFPNLRFGAMFIGSRPDDYGDIRYALPDNLVFLDTMYLFGSDEKAEIRPVDADPETMRTVDQMHGLFHSDPRHPDCARMFASLASEAHQGGKLSHDVFLHSKAAWNRVKDNYRRHCTDPSFVDYFWTVRTIHTPFWRLREALDRCPSARIYHAVSTGYAGILGVMLKHRTQRPYIISEHGIYVKERKIDLYQAQWIKDNRNVFEFDPSQMGYYRQLWLRFFEQIGYFAYQAADHIVALYEANRQRQLRDGAQEERTRNIPNGIDVVRFGRLRQQRPATPPPVLCLIGRVVPIKDVKTFIRSMRTVVAYMPEAEAWIAGPEEEDPEYAEECRDLVRRLGLEQHVKFLGFQKLDELLPKIGLVVLSSISEALPLVVLEGYAAGVPALTTDVGSCRQLVYGLPGEDEKLGVSGRTVRIADPEALGTAALELLQPDQWKAASEAAVKRVETYYSQDLMFARYDELYRKSLEWQA